MTTTFDVNKRTAQYVALRDRINELDEAHEATMRPYRETLNELNNALLQHLDGQKVNSMRTDAGTVYVSERASATVADGAAFFDFVQSTELWDLLERRANVTAVRAYIDALVERAKTDPAVLPVPPAGINFNILRRVGVRRS